MFTTAEVRWFFEGPIPDEIEQWSCSSLALDAAPREDHYLLFPAALCLGLKLREGWLEIKYLVESVGIHTFMPDCTGPFRVWTKDPYGEPPVKEFKRLTSTHPNPRIAL